MANTPDLTTLAGRIEWLIEKTAGGKLRKFAQMCSAVDSKKAPTYEAIRNYTRRGSEPGLEKAAIMARAAGVSIEWLATGEGLEAGAPAVDESRRARVAGGTPFAEAERRIAGSKLIQESEGPAEKAAELPGVRHEAYGQFLFGFDITIYKRKDGPIRVDWTGELPEPGDGDAD